MKKEDEISYYSGYSTDPQREIEKDEARSKLLAAIKKLSERERMIISLHYYEDLTLKEIADTLDVKYESVLKVHQKILESLKTSLD